MLDTLHDQGTPALLRHSLVEHLAATDGTEATAGVLANDVDATLADRADALLIARHAFAASRALVWPAGRHHARPENRRHRPGVRVKLTL